jgi:hypothetical protein
MAGRDASSKRVQTRSPFLYLEVGSTDEIVSDHVKEEFQIFIQTDKGSRGQSRT